jgi:predicted nucleic acid-binding Zn ribbon protein
VKTRSIYPGKAHINAIPTTCPWCGETVPPGKKNCPGCGSPAKVAYDPSGARHGPYGKGSEDDWEWRPKRSAPEEKNHSHIWLLILAVIVVVVAVLLWKGRSARREAANLPPAASQSGMILGGAPNVQAFLFPEE